MPTTKIISVQMFEAASNVLTTLNWYNISQSTVLTLVLNVLASFKRRKHVEISAYTGPFRRCCSESR